MDTMVWLAIIGAVTSITVAALPLLFRRISEIQTVVAQTLETADKTKALGEETHKLANNTLTAQTTLTATTKAERDEARQQLADLKMMIMAGRTGGAAPAPAPAAATVPVEIVNAEPVHVDQVDKAAKEKP